MLLLLLLGMLVVLEELVVFVEGIFERVKSKNLKKNYRIQKDHFCSKIKKKSFR